jgi:hypothetical protein
MSILEDYGEGMLDTYRGGVVGTFFFDLFTVPWGGAYASTDYSKMYRYTVSTFPQFDRNSTDVHNSTLQIHAFLAPPTVPSAWVPRFNAANPWCFKLVSFPVYTWPEVLILEIADGLGSVFVENARSEENNLNSVIVEINCSNKTNVYRARVNYIGVNATQIYTLPSEIRCSDAPPECQVTGTFTDVTPSSQYIPNIIPIVECVSAVTASNYTVYFGYNNTDSALFNVPVGPLNTFSGVSNRGQTSNFLTGRSSYWPTTAFTAQFSAGTFSWRLTNFNLTFATTDQSLACPTNVTLRVQIRTSITITQEELSLISNNIATQLGLDPTQVTMRLVSGTKKRQSADISQLEVEISTVSPDTEAPPASPSQIVQDFVQLAANETTAQQTFNPLNDTSRAIISIETIKTGVEQSGQQIVNGPATSNEPSGGISPKSNNIPAVSDAYAIRLSLGDQLFYYLLIMVIIALGK